VPRKTTSLDDLLGRAGKRPIDLAAETGCVSAATVDRRRAGRRISDANTTLLRDAMRRLLPGVTDADLDAALPFRSASTGARR
jgi:hypothetical protein